MDKVLISFGHGYSAQALAHLLIPQGWVIYGTTRKEEKCAALTAQGITPVLWPDGDLREAFEHATHFLISAAPDEAGDPTLQRYQAEIEGVAPRLEWAGYLSTTGVYGDHQGDWVNERAALTPATKRGRMRVEAEAAWGAIPDLPLHIFRLAGIYGPRRGPFEKVRNGTARRIIKKGQIFSRIHVEDIAQVLAASMARPNPGAAYNVCDNEPAPPQDVIGYAAALLGLPTPEEVAFEGAAMSPMARSFYAESKKVDNSRIRNELGIELIYPDYRTGLRALLAYEKG